MNLTNKKLIEFWIDTIVKYIRDVEKIKIDPLPEVQLLDGTIQPNDADNVLISTGGYMPSTRTIVLYIDNRHIKDILRSYCHELIHHAQNIDNSDYIRRLFNMPEKIVDNPQLEEIEGDAYLRGNLVFRKFTEWFKSQQEKTQ